MPPRGDEVTPIVEYIVKEMNTNRASSTAQKILELNSYDYEACIKEYVDAPWYRQLFMDPQICSNTAISTKLAAWLAWAEKVRTGAEWDHKPFIRSNFHPAVPNGTQEWHHHQGYVYYYDIWSNIHYGYVGTACGFSQSALLDGAGLEQLGSLPWRMRPGVSGLRRFDDSSDQAAITIGIKLFPNAATVRDVLEAVVKSTELEKKPL